MKKSMMLVAMLAAICLLLTACSGGAKRAAIGVEGLRDGAFVYNLWADGTARIAGYADFSATTVAIPETLDGHAVTGVVGNPFKFCQQLTEFTVAPDHPVLAVIDGVLFEKQSKKLVAYPSGRVATEYTVPQGIVAIGDEAFASCRNLTSITLPEGVTSIGGLLAGVSTVGNG